jgi:prophage regulatory protein
MPKTARTAHDGVPSAATLIGPLLVSAVDAARMCGVSLAGWWRLHAAGKVPAPVKLNGRTLWKTEELRSWVAAGCPDRRAWETTRRDAPGHPV